MKIRLESLKRFLNTAAITSQLEITVSEGVMKINTYNTMRNVVLETVMRDVNHVGSMVIRIDKPMFDKYLHSFSSSSILEITANDDVIVLNDGKLKITVPQLAGKVIDLTKEVTEPTWTLDATVVLEIADIKRIVAVADNLERNFIRITCKNGKVTALMRRDVIYEATSKGSGADFDITFKKSSLLDGIKNATKPVLLKLSATKFAPVVFAYEDENFDARGFILPEEGES